MQLALDLPVLCLSGERTGHESCPDDCDDKHEGRKQVEQCFRTFVEKKREISVDFARCEPCQDNDDASPTDGEERCTDSNENLTGHGVTPLRDAACGTSRIDTSVPAKDYGPIGEGSK
jgi:hypothetical protein